MAKMQEALEFLTEKVKAVRDSVGNLTTLTTTQKTSIVEAVNELKTSIPAAVDVPGIMAAIATNAASIVSLGDRIGALAGLATTAKTSVIEAINEVNTKATDNTDYLNIVTTKWGA